MTKKLIAGNWKMNGGLAANEALVQAMLAGIGQPAADVALCVPAPYLAQLQSLLQGSAIAWGSQDVSAHEQGAYTGEVSVAMLKDSGLPAGGRTGADLDCVPADGGRRRGW